MSAQPGDVTLAMAAYSMSFLDVQRAVAQRNAQSAVLRAHATGPAVTQLGLAVQEFVQAGYVTRGVPALHAHVVSVNPSGQPPSVSLTACPVPAALFSLSTGKPLAVTVVSRHPVAVTVEQSGGRWLVYDVEDQGTGSCAA